MLSHQLRRFADAETVVHEALQEVRDPEARALLEGARAAMIVTRGERVQVDAEALVGAAPTAVLAAVLELTADGRIDRAARLAMERLATASEWRAEFATIDLFLDLARTRALLLNGQIVEAQDHADAAYDAAVIEGAEFPRAIWSLARGIVFVARGLPRDAIPALREAAGSLENAERGFRRPTHAYLAMGAALAGDITEAERDGHTAQLSNPSLDGVFGVDVARAEAWVLAARGEFPPRRRRGQAAADVAATRQHHAFEASRSTTSRASHLPRRGRPAGGIRARSSTGRWSMPSPRTRADSPTTTVIGSTKRRARSRR